MFLVNEMAKGVIIETLTPYNLKCHINLTRKHAGAFNMHLEVTFHDDCVTWNLVTSQNYDITENKLFIFNDSSYSRTLTGKFKEIKTYLCYILIWNDWGDNKVISCGRDNKIAVSSPDVPLKFDSHRRNVLLSRFYCMNIFILLQRYKQVAFVYYNPLFLSDTTIFFKEYRSTYIQLRK